MQQCFSSPFKNNSDPNVSSLTITRKLTIALCKGYVCYQGKQILQAKDSRFKCTDLVQKLTNFLSQLCYILFSSITGTKQNAGYRTLHCATRTLWLHFKPYWLPGDTQIICSQRSVHLPQDRPASVLSAYGKRVTLTCSPKIWHSLHYGLPDLESSASSS